MGGLGFTELIVIGAAVLIFFGPKRLPELAKSLGQGIREFKKAMEPKSDKSDNADAPQVASKNSSEEPHES